MLRALSRRSGNLVWTRKLPSRPSGGAQRVDNVVLVPFTTELIGAYQTTTGAEAFTIRPVGTLVGAPVPARKLPRDGTTPHRHEPGGCAARIRATI